MDWSEDMASSPTAERHRGKIPQVLLDFMRAPGGHSLMLKGDAGTGKTTLALQIIEELSEEQPDYYLSTRVSDEALFRQFPWARDRAKRDTILKAGKAFLKRNKDPPAIESPAAQHLTLLAAKDLLKALNKQEGSPSVVRSELQKLEGQVEAGEVGGEGEEGFTGEITQDEITLDLGVILPEMEVAYDLAESNLPRKTLVVVDSIDALSERYGIGSARIINTLQKDLVENSGTNVVYTLEKAGKTELDYLGDGVIQLLSEDRGGRRIRQMVVEKLRGVSVDQWKYFFTLTGGRISVLEPTWVKIPERMQKHTAHKDPNARTVSSGNSSIDQYFGGFPKGSLVLWEFDLDVHLDVVRCLELGVMSDFLDKGRGVVWLPTYATDYSLIDEQLRMLVGPAPLNKGIRILDMEAGQEQPYSFITAIEGEDAAQDLRMSSLKFMLGDSASPYLSILGYDAMEGVYTGNVFKQTLGHIDAMRRAGHVVIAITSTMSQSLPSLREQAKIHIRFENMAGCIMAAGMKPHTPYYYLDFVGKADALPAPRLVPMI
jgi:KaiC/GvpD/RAD55 family RecA-like ATPase